MADEDLRRLLAPLELESPPQARKDAVRAAIRRNTEAQRPAVDAAQAEDERALRAQLAHAIEAVPAGLKRKARERVQAATADQRLVDEVPGELRARVRAQIVDASARARAAAAAPRRQPYALFALAASLVLGVAVVLLLDRSPDGGGISTLGPDAPHAKARERICALARAGKDREALEEFDKHLRRQGKPASPRDIEALCRP